MASLAPRVILSLLWAGLCAAFLAAPLLRAMGYSQAAALLFALFSPVCHQDADRSFTLLGHQWAVCHRCSGIYFGLFLASLLPFRLTRILDAPQLRRLWVACAAAPILLDALGPFLGVWTNTPFSRLATGFVFGAMLSLLLSTALEEFIHEARWKRKRFDAGVLGGLS